MKNLKIFIATIFALSVSAAWADLTMPETSIEVCSETTGICSLTNDVCSPIIHFKLPKKWTRAYLMIAGSGIPFPKADKDGWSTIDLGSSKSNNASSFFINSTNQNDCNNKTCLTSKGANVAPRRPDQDGFTCKMLGNTKGVEVWIMEHPDPRKSGQIYMSPMKPIVKDFYVFLPQNSSWKSSIPKINEDGTDLDLNISDYCGWYYRRYIDEALPTSVLIHKDDDTSPYKEAIGMNGTWETNRSQPTPISIGEMFSRLGNPNQIFFVADEDQLENLPNSTVKGWRVDFPDITGNCSYYLAATIYDTDASLHPAFSCYMEGAGSTAEGCQAISGVAAQGVDKTTALTAINNCIGITPGIVESTLDPVTKKPKLSTKGKTCFIDDAYFNQLFNYTKGVNEKSCFDMPFTQTNDGKWEFDSDYFTSPGLDYPVQGGFYPVEASTDASILAADPNQTPISQARTKYDADGPVFWGPELRAISPTEQVPIIDIFCNGPGWSGGYNCNGLFADGTTTEKTIIQKLNLQTNSCVFGWSCGTPNYAPEEWPIFQHGTEKQIQSTSSDYVYRWRSETNSNSLNRGRNQHYCFESHANFRFKHGLKFSFRGDDDIWVFIDNKLAVDLGGTHLAAPGYVDLDKFMPNAEVGKNYDIDIFFCDRRTTMSNVRIKTNMYLEQKVGIEINPNSTDNNFYEICYKASGNGSCASTTVGEQRFCGTEIINAGIRITYYLTTDKTGTDPSQTIISEEDFLSVPRQLGGGIDVSDPTKPIVDIEVCKKYLQANKHYLFVKIGSDRRAMEIITGDPESEEISSSSSNKNSSASKESKSSSSVSKDSKSSSSTGKDSKSSSSSKNSKSNSSSSASDSESEDSTAPSFRVKMVAPFEFDIVLNEDLPALAKQYAVMDMNGQVLSVGELTSADTRVKVPTSGSYVVKVGLGFRRVNVK